MTCRRRDSKSKLLLAALEKDGYQYGRTITDDLGIKIAEKRLFNDYNSSKSIKFGHESHRSNFFKGRSRRIIEFHKHGLLNVGLVLNFPLLGAIGSTGEAGVSYFMEKEESSRETSLKQLIAKNDFRPMYTIRLSELNLELSKDAKNFFQKNEIITIKRIREFFREFGVFVNNKLWIGGASVYWNVFTQESKRNTNSSKHGESATVDLGPLANVLGKFRASFEQNKRNTNISNESLNECYVQVTGGTEVLLGDSQNWLESINEEKNLRVIFSEEHKYTYEYLDENLKKQFIIFHTMALEENDRILKEREQIARSLGSNINLSNLEPIALCIIKEELFVFFPFAIHVFELPSQDQKELKSIRKVPSEFKKIKSVAVLKEFVYVSTPEGLFELNPKTFKACLASKTFQNCLILPYQNYLYAFLNKVVQFDTVTGETKTITNSSDWDKTSHGIVKDKHAYVAWGGLQSIWKINLDSSYDQTKIYSYFSKKKIHGVCFFSQPNPYFVEDELCFLEGEPYKRQITRREYTYKDCLCTASNGKLLYVVLKEKDPSLKPTLYQVMADGSRNKLEGLIT